MGQRAEPDRRGTVNACSPRAPGLQTRWSRRASRRTTPEVGRGLCAVGGFVEHHVAHVDHLSEPRPTVRPEPRPCGGRGRARGSWGRPTGRVSSTFDGPDLDRDPGGLEPLATTGGCAREDDEPARSGVMPAPGREDPSRCSSRSARRRSASRQRRAPPSSPAAASGRAGAQGVSTATKVDVRRRGVDALARTSGPLVARTPTSSEVRPASSPSPGAPRSAVGGFGALNTSWSWPQSRRSCGEPLAATAAQMSIHAADLAAETGPERVAVAGHHDPRHLAPGLEGDDLRGVRVGDAVWVSVTVPRVPGNQPAGVGGSGIRDPPPGCGGAWDRVWIGSLMRAPRGSRRDTRALSKGGVCRSRIGCSRVRVIGHPQSRTIWSWLVAYSNKERA